MLTGDTPIKSTVLDGRALYGLLFIRRAGIMVSLKATQTSVPLIFVFRDRSYELCEYLNKLN